jgi:hypothetical protein
VLGEIPNYYIDIYGKEKAKRNIDNFLAIHKKEWEERMFKEHGEVTFEDYP